MKYKKYTPQEAIDILQKIAKKTGYTFKFDDVDIWIDDKEISIKGQPKVEDAKWFNSLAKSPIKEKKCDCLCHKAGYVYGSCGNCCVKSTPTQSFDNKVPEKIAEHFGINQNTARLEKTVNSIIDYLEAIK